MAISQRPIDPFKPDEAGGLKTTAYGWSGDASWGAITQFRGYTAAQANGFTLSPYPAAPPNGGPPQTLGGVIIPNGTTIKTSYPKLAKYKSAAIL